MTEFQKSNWRCLLWLIKRTPANDIDMTHFKRDERNCGICIAGHYAEKFEPLLGKFPYEEDEEEDNEYIRRIFGNYLYGWKAFGWNLSSKKKDCVQRIKNVIKTFE